MSLGADEDVLSVTLHDEALHDELVLLVDVVVAASESAVPLTQAQIDRVLSTPRVVRQRSADRAEVAGTGRLGDTP
jgi:hypothetical protein